MASLFKKKNKRGRAVPSGSKLEPLVLRGFDGGLNVVDDDTNMEPSYQVDLVNFRRTPAGARKSRLGSKWFADVSSAVTGRIAGLQYFSDHLISPTTTGQMASTSNSGVVTDIWDSTIAGALPGAPSGWSATTDVEFVPWKDQLIVHNGVDKPVIISAALAVTYLQDLATGSNVNTPIGKYGCIAANYHCVGGIASAPTTIYISARGTSGTFPGDPAPNDAISIDVGAYAPSGAPEILGMAGYRQFLIVFFRGQSLIIRLGVYDDTGNHTPEFLDEMPTFGLLNHHCLASVENDLRFAGFDGLASAKRNLFSGNIDSKYLSALIEPSWRTSVAASTSVFVVHNPLEHATYIFVNDNDGTLFVYEANEQLKYQSWTKYKGFVFAVGCRSFLGRVFVANKGVSHNGSTIYQLGNDVFSGEDYELDDIDDRIGNWANNTAYTVGQRLRDTATVQSYTCAVNHTSAMAGTFAADRALHPTYWTLFNGTSLDARIEMPWIDGRTPMRTKQNRFISIDSRGDGAFTVDVYVDQDDTNVAATMDFVGNEAGSGRRSGDPRLYKFPFKFKSMKLVIRGTLASALTIAGIRFLFSRGKYRR